MSESSRNFIINYLKGSKSKKILLAEKIKEIDAVMLNAKIDFANCINLLEQNESSPLKSVYQERLRAIGTRIQEYQKNLRNLSILSKVFDRIDITVLALPPESQEAIFLYYGKGLSYKELQGHCNNSIQYIHNLINQGINTIYHNIQGDDLALLIRWLF